MAGGPPSPYAAPPAPGFPNTPGVYLFEGFSGLNTKPGRSQIEDDQCHWIENFQPTGKSTVRTVYGAGSPAYTTTGASIVTFDFVGILNVANNVAQDYCVAVLSDGSVVAIKLPSNSAATIAPAGTITSPTQGTIQIKGFGGGFVSIVTSNQVNGYFIWDGTAFYGAGTLSPQIVLDNAGSIYSADPSVGVFGGTGSGATLTAQHGDFTVDSISVTNAGSGYGAYDHPILTFDSTYGAGTFTTATAVALFDAGSQSINSVSIVNPGSGYTSTTTATAVGGTGGGASLTVTVSGGSVTSITVVNGGSGYNGGGYAGFNPTIDIQDPNNPIAHGYVIPMPYGVSGNCIENYVNRQWLSKGPVVEFSAAGSPSDFTTTDGAGAFSSTDPFLRTTFNALRQANGFLYLLGDSSINYISGVGVSSANTVTFTNLNVNPTIGVSWPQAILTFNNQIMFANWNGLFSLNGGAVQKASAPLDRIWPSQATVGTFLPSMAGMTVNGTECFCILIPIISPITNATANKLLCSDGSRWWSATQEPNLFMVATYESNSLRTAYGTDGTSIYPLFQNPSTALQKILQSKLFSVPGYWYTKVTRRLYGNMSYINNASGTVTVTPENENGPSPTPVVVSPPSALGPFVFGPFAVSEPGALGGMTITTNVADAEFYSFAVVEQMYSANT